MIKLEGSARELLFSCRIAHLATADDVGRPAVVPICYAFDGRTIYSSIDEKKKSVAASRLKRVRNIKRNPRVSLVIDDYSEDWRKIRYVLVQAVAQIIEPGGGSAEEHQHAVVLLREKYPQYRCMAIDTRPVIKVVPARIKLWTAAQSTLA